MIEGCDHCGMVLEWRDQGGTVNCPECGRPLRHITAVEALSLKRERRVAEQFRRAARITPPSG